MEEITVIFNPRYVVLISAFALSGCGVFDAPRTFTDPSYALSKVVSEDLVDDAVDDAIDDAKDGITDDNCKYNAGGLVCTEDAPAPTKPASDSDSTNSASFGPPMGCVMDSALATDLAPPGPQQCAANSSQTKPEFEYQVMPSAAGSDALTVTVKVATNSDTLGTMLEACNSCSPASNTTFDCCTVYCACLMASK